MPITTESTTALNDRFFLITRTKSSQGAIAHPYGIPYYSMQQASVSTKSRWKWMRRDYRKNQFKFGHVDPHDLYPLFVNPSEIVIALLLASNQMCWNQETVNWFKHLSASSRWTHTILSKISSIWWLITSTFILVILCLVVNYFSRA